MQSKATLDSAVYHVLVSSPDTKAAFNTGFDTDNLHSPAGERTAADTARPKTNAATTARIRATPLVRSFLVINGAIPNCFRDRSTPFGLTNQIDGLQGRDDAGEARTAGRSKE